VKHRILLDTDMGSDVDDALCLALALAMPDIELAAVTTVSADTRHRAKIAKKILELAGREDVPVYAGVVRPSTAGSKFAWTGEEGEGILRPEDRPRVEEEPARNAIARLLRSEDDLEIVAVGPMTNVAAVLEKDPSLASRIEKLTIMGGHVRGIRYHDFVFQPGVDYNLCSDPEASLRVLRTDVPTRLVTGDVTLQVWLRPEDLARLEASRKPIHKALARSIRMWTPTQRRIFGSLGATIGEENVAFLHDPLALACVSDESFCTFEDLAIEPAMADGTFRTFERPSGASGARTMHTATAVDAARFRDFWVERVLQLPG